jgi:CDP-paratose 2-epimerase
MQEHILITGGAGFVGSSLALLMKRKYPKCVVTAFDNLYRRGSELNLPRLAASNVHFHHGDVRSLTDVLSIDPFPTLIIHAAAEPSAQAGYNSQSRNLLNTNLTGTFNSLELARVAKADLIFLSTSRVYPFSQLNALVFEEGHSRFELAKSQFSTGVSENGISETFPLDGPRSLYGMTKLASELMIEEYADAYGLRFIILRLGLLAGPWQMMKADQGVVALWVAAHYFRRKLSYRGFGGRGKQVRDVLHVDDLGDLVSDQFEHFADYAGKRFNVGGGAAFALSLAETTELCRLMTGNHIDIGSQHETHSTDVRIYISDNRQVSGVRGWVPKHPPERTLADMYAWIHGNPCILEKIFFT